MNKITTYLLGIATGVLIAHSCENYKAPTHRGAYWNNRQSTVRIHDDTTKAIQPNNSTTNFMVGTPKGLVEPTSKNLYHSYNLDAGFWQTNKNLGDILEEDARKKEFGTGKPAIRAIMVNDTLYTIHPDSIYVGFDGISGYQKMGRK